MHIHCTLCSLHSRHQPTDVGFMITDLEIFLLKTFIGTILYQNR